MERRRKTKQMTFKWMAANRIKLPSKDESASSFLKSLSFFEFSFHFSIRVKPFSRQCFASSTEIWRNVCCVSFWLRAPLRPFAMMNDCRTHSRRHIHSHTYYCRVCVARVMVGRRYGWRPTSIKFELWCDLGCSGVVVFLRRSMFPHPPQTTYS